MDIKREWFDWNNKDYIRSRIQDKQQPYEDKILKYLKAGNSIAASASVIYDCFKPEIRISTNSYTDTKWEWHDTLIYYVENYHYRISDEFLNHMRKQSWKVLQLTKEEIISLIKDHVSK